MAGDVNVNDSNERKPTTFFDLPPELRNRVYDMVINSEGYRVESCRAWSVYCPAKSLNLDQVNRQLRYESIPRYWRAMTLYVTYEPFGIPSMRYLKDLGDVRIRCVRRFSLFEFDIVLAGGASDTNGEKVVVQLVCSQPTSNAKSFVIELKAYVEEKLQEDNGWVYLTVKTVAEIAKLKWERENEGQY